MHRVSVEQAEKALALAKKSKDLKYLLNFKMINGKDVKNPRNFPKAKRILTVIRSSSGARQIWGIPQEANDAFSLCPPPPAYFDDRNVKRLQQYCAGRLPLFVHPSLYRALKLTFPLDIGGLSPDNTVRIEMGTGSIGQDVGVLSSAMFNAEEQGEALS